jgi:EspA/EspE family
MFIFADAARIITNLSSLGSQFICVESPQFSGEYLAASVSSMAADALTPFAAIGFAKRSILLRKTLSPEQFSRIATRTLGDAGKKASAAASIILWTITIVEILELTTGLGPPDEGGRLKAGSQQFSTLDAQLKSALPDGSWQGLASEAYAGLDTVLQNLAQTMAGLDLQLADVVENQAEWVTHMRLGFGILKDVLLVAFLTEVTMTLLPSPAGPVPARIFGLTVSGLGIAIATGFLATLCTFSFENAKKADALASEYSQAAARSVQHGSLAQTKVATAGQSAVSSFEAISAGMSGMADEPIVASLAGAASGSEKKRAPLAAQMSQSEPPSGGTPEVPAVTMPLLAQVSAMSGQASTHSGNVSPHADLVNQAMGHIQQVAHKPPQRQGAAAPPEDTALAGDAEGAGAATGTAATERAPIEIAAAVDQENPDMRSRVL